MRWHYIWDDIIFMYVVNIWQYGLWSFQTGDTKLERFLPKNQHTQRKLLNFENWISGSLRGFQKLEFLKSNIFIFSVKKYHKLISSFGQKMPTKRWKSHPQKLLRKTQIPLLPGLPKWPKQKNSCSKMWLKEQLYIKLGSYPFFRA